MGVERDCTEAQALREDVCEGVHTPTSTPAAAVHSALSDRRQRRKEGREREGPSHQFFIVSCIAAVHAAFARRFRMHTTDVKRLKD